MNKEEIKVKLNELYSKAIVRKDYHLAFDILCDLNKYDREGVKIKLESLYLETVTIDLRLAFNILNYLKRI